MENQKNLTKTTKTLTTNSVRFTNRDDQELTKYEVRLTEPEIMRETYWTCNYGDHIVEAESKGEAMKKVLQALKDGDIEVQEYDIILPMGKSLLNHYVEDHYDNPNVQTKLFPKPEPPKPEIDEVVEVSDDEEAEF